MGKKTREAGKLHRENIKSAKSKEVKYSDTTFKGHWYRFGGYTFANDWGTKTIRLIENCSQYQEYNDYMDAAKNDLDGEPNGLYTWCPEEGWVKYPLTRQLKLVLHLSFNLEGCYNPYDVREPFDFTVDEINQIKKSSESTVVSTILWNLSTTVLSAFRHLN